MSGCVLLLQGLTFEALASVRFGLSACLIKHVVVCYCAKSGEASALVASCGACCHVMPG